MKKKKYVYTELTERRGHVCDESDDTGGNEKVIDSRIESNHWISDDSEEHRYSYEDRRLRQRLTQEIYIRTIHTVPMLP